RKDGIGSGFRRKQPERQAGGSKMRSWKLQIVLTSLAVSNGCRRKTGRATTANCSLMRLNEVRHKTRKAGTIGGPTRSRRIDRTGTELSRQVKKPMRIRGLFLERRGMISGSSAYSRAARV